MRNRMPHRTEYQMPISWDLFWHNEIGELDKRASADGWTKAKAALCPFHADKNPGTVYVNILTGSFKCWSCGEKHSAAHFVQQVHGLSYPQSMRYVEQNQ